MRSIALFVSKRFSVCCVFATIALLLFFISSPAVVAMDRHSAASSTGTRAALSPMLQDGSHPFYIGIPRSLFQEFSWYIQKLINTGRDPTP